MGTTGAERTSWFSHWTQQQGKVECNKSHKKKTSITVKITCLLRRKENENSKSEQTEKQTFLEQSQYQTLGLTEITYGIKGLWSQSHPDVILTVFNNYLDIS